MSYVLISIIESNPITMAMLMFDGVVINHVRKRTRKLNNNYRKMLLKHFIDSTKIGVLYEPPPRLTQVEISQLQERRVRVESREPQLVTATPVGF